MCTMGLITPPERALHPLIHPHFFGPERPVGDAAMHSVWSALDVPMKAVVQGQWALK